MKRLTSASSFSVIFSVVLFLLILLGSPVSFSADAKAEFSPDEVVAELKSKLSLNDQQVKGLTAALAELGENLDALISKQETAKKKDDPTEFIKGVKQAQADYQKKLKGILDSKQLESYNALKESAIMDMLKDLAEIKLLDIQPEIGFSDEQLEQLAPVMAESMQGFMKTAWEHAGKRLRMRQKIKVAKILKRIQSNAKQQVQKILTSKQYQIWEELKKQQQVK
ncbi:MAG: hypothetical protein JMN27_00805 [gamma proteobacterium endosymbiont of Lamellibrachia anaximandri]|nr:hypothetical protein [gamma proteobacterium endosymbiont of Lamellibrachia anaximandri]MBL3532355.1 hypothetical protein [gamma proteobacterium endosymbiont of Lamellibrachia anaximandri]